jgi:hypothetical protein
LTDLNALPAFFIGSANLKFFSGVMEAGIEPKFSIRFANSFTASQTAPSAREKAHFARYLHKDTKKRGRPAEIARFAPFGPCRKHYLP